MRRALAVLALLLVSPNAWATKLCVVDFQRAVTETQEGLGAQKKIDTMYSSRKAELERMQMDLQKAVQDYQARAMILSADARAAEEQKLGLQQQTFERTYMQYQQEMQQTYMTLLGDLDQKMRTIAGAIGKEQGCTVAIDNAVVVYAGPDLADITDALVARYNAQHPSTAP